MRLVHIQLVLIVIIWFIWFFMTGYSQIIDLFTSYFPIMVIMLFGSFVAGSTSLGGGAVAFPVFTKVLSIPSDTALVFSLAIQSIGMTAASLMLLLSRTPIVKKVILISVIPGAFGVYLGLFHLNGLFAEGQTKYAFSVFSLFVALVLIYDRFINHRNLKEPEFNKGLQDISTYVIVFGSLVGGVLSGLIGTGIDFVLFTLMILFSKVGLKNAVATSVCVMAINAVIGFSMVYFFTGDFSGVVVDYWLAAVPIVVVGGPLGALACKYLHRDIIFYFLMVLIFLDALSTSWILGKQMYLLITCVGLAGCLICWLLRNKIWRLG